jgi:hypothetical protein
MATDAGYPRGTPENEQMAQQIEYDHMMQTQAEADYHDAMEAEYRLEMEKQYMEDMRGRE